MLDKKIDVRIIVLLCMTIALTNYVSYEYGKRKGIEKVIKILLNQGEKT
jgi:hypothetical protein